MISVIGGTYREINYDGMTIEIFGSGLRCCKYLLENGTKVKFQTSGDISVERYLKQYSKVYPDFTFKCNPTEDLITFKYSFALDEPQVFPNMLNISKTEIGEINDQNIICYGMLESNFKLTGKCIVYDPQTSIKPVPFSDFGNAEQLIYIVNMDEAKSISGSDDITKIKKYFFYIEKAYAFIIKNGPFGATLFYKNREIKIPSYITSEVNKIGSGDIFTASFGFYWMIKKYSLEDCAYFASKSTALYCDNNNYSSINIESTFNFKEFDNINLRDKQVYLASPIFSLSDLILIDKIREAFLGFGIKVFSPFHDIGLGDKSSIAKLDLDGINKSDIIFFVFDNLDPGTLIESGYVMALDKKIIAYHRTCKDEDLLMLSPSKISFYNNLTTAIYHTIWSL